jgi:hypothetical protein
VHTRAVPCAKDSTFLMNINYLTALGRGKGGR